jgi:hypothetical protein
MSAVVVGVMLAAVPIIQLAAKLSEKRRHWPPRPTSATRRHHGDDPGDDQRAKPEGTQAPMGQLIRMREYPTAAFRDVTAPNADTLYTAG